jgi:23S rRNA (uracil1939-C5)-methyltransferase
MMQEIKKGGEVVLPVEKLAFGGRAVARLDNFVVFLEHALPGQRVLARITRKKRQYAEARVLEVLSQSTHYVEPFCPHFGTCGGCSWQDLDYDQQLHWKRQHVLESLVHLAGVEEATVEPTVPSPHTQYYRNKMEYTFSNRRWLLPEEIASKEIQYGRDFALGLHVRGFYDKVFDVEACFLQSPQSVEILKETREWCKNSGLPAYTTAGHHGYWRFLVIREGKRTDQTLVHIITSAEGDHESVVDGLAEHLMARFPKITTIVHSVSRKKAQVAFGDYSRNVVGPGFIEERFASLTFRISPHSFFQTNPYAAEKLYETVARFGEFTGRETVWDLYCGTGSIALSIASQVRRVVGFEVVEDAIQDAYDNCRLNAIDNCLFHAGDLKDVIKHMDGSAHQGEFPDVVVTDPPRAGMHPHVVKALMDLAPPRIIAVSCNPATLARDLAVLLESYEIKKVQPFDLFPHTPHIECVVRLDRK